MHMIEIVSKDGEERNVINVDAITILASRKGGTLLLLWRIEGGQPVAIVVCADAEMREYPERLELQPQSR